MKPALPQISGEPHLGFSQAFPLPAPVLSPGASAKWWVLCPAPQVQGAGHGDSLLVLVVPSPQVAHGLLSPVALGTPEGHQPADSPAGGGQAGGLDRGKCGLTGVQV